MSRWIYLALWLAMISAACTGTNTGGACTDSSMCPAGSVCTNGSCVLGDGADLAMPGGDLAMSPDMAVPPAAPICSSGGWCWQNPMPQGNTLNAVWASAPNSVWAVGIGGTIIYNNGGGWSRPNSNTPATLNGVWGSSATNVFAVGQNGTVVRWDGAQWSAAAMGIPAIVNLNGVWGVDANNIWAVGVNGNTSQGVVFKWNSATSQWAQQTVPMNTLGLNGVWAADATHIWAVGARGTILFSNNGTTFVAQTAVGLIEFRSVYGYDANNVFTVGNFATSMNINVTSNGGTTWTAQNSNIAGGAGAAVQLFSVFAADATHVWAFGPDGVTDFYNGTTWTVQLPSLTPLALNGSFGTSIGNVLAVGANGVIEQYNGNQYSLQSSGTPAQLNGVYAADATHVYAVGQLGTIYFYNGTTWSAQTSGTMATLTSVWASDANTAWAVGAPGMMGGGATILKTTTGGAQWTAQTSGLMGQTLNKIHGVSATRLWAVGTGGSIRTTSDGGMTWTMQTSGITDPLTSVFAADANTVFAVAAAPVAGNTAILRTLNGGTTWTTQNSNTTVALSGIWGASATNLWAVGNNGTILTTVNGGMTWTTQMSGVSALLLGIWGSSATDIYAVGQLNQSVLRFDGTNWTQQSTPAATVLQAVGISGASKWVVGNGGSILFHP